ncbi:putative oxidoreductase [Medicago truncatula]|uniref:Putative oxidoreductase n=1 Tax=Medicago truncatula TaxID=3880 RepID=A0A396GVG9_MEDTR|nr:putative oxidoreductase [Medicago truncatula]
MNKVTIVGSGNWGSVAAKLIASNTIKLSNFHGTFSSSTFFFYLS